MGSSDSRPEHPQARHFTEINSRALRSQTSNPTHPRPTNTSRAATSTSNRTPNYMYQVPQDENIHLVRRNTDATSVSTVGASSSSTVSNPSSSSVIASTTVSRPVNVMPPSSSTVTTAKPPVQQGSTTSSYKSSSASNSSPVTASNTSMPSSVSSVTNTKSPGSTAVSNNTSSMNSKFEKINLQNANNSMSDLTASGSVDSSSLNNRNSASKENLNSGHRKNAYQRQRNNNANGDSQAGHRSQFNNRRGAGNRQPHNRNHRQRFESPNDNELTRDNRANRRHDSGNRQNPRNRNPRNNFSDGRSTENRNPRNRFTDDGPTENSGDEKTKEVHDAFMKKLVGTFPPNHDKFRGLFCAACNHYEVFIGKRPKVKHIDTHMHNSKLRENPSIKSMSCSSCKIMLHCDVKFLVAHKKSEIHIFISDQKRRADASSAEPTSNDVDNSVKGDNTLNLKGEIKQKFLERLNLSSEINDYSFYCHLCEQWFTNHVIWDEHLKNQHNDDEKKLMNMTFKHCQACKLMMCGSNLLSLFHTDAEEHEKFRTFLNIPSVESDDDDVDDRDDVSTTSSAAARDRNSQNPVYLVLKNLPPVTSRRDIFAYFKDFGRLENWTMNPIGENTAVVQFSFGSVAENIINSNFPLEIHGSRIEAGLQYL